MIQAPLVQASPVDHGQQHRGQHGGYYSEAPSCDTSSKRSSSSSSSSKYSSSVHKNRTQRYRAQVQAADKGRASTENAEEAGSKNSNKSAQKLMPFLFDMLDLDQSGTLDRNEVVVGVTKLIRDSRLNVSSQSRFLQSIGKLMTQVDADSNGKLDRREFGKFLFRLSTSLGMSLDHLAQALIDVHGLQHDTKNRYDAKTWDDVPVLFNKWDESGDGKISRHEISVAMRKFDQIKLSFGEIMVLFDENDENGDAELDENEFATYLASFSLASGIPLAEAIAFLLTEAGNSKEMDLALEGWKMMPMLFDVWDEDKSGVIERTELVDNIGMLIQELGLPITLSEVWTILGEVDDNGDQSLDRHEFGFFLSSFAKQANVTLEEITFYLSKLHREGRSSKTLKEGLRGWDSMEKLFQMWDTDNNQYIDRRELGIGMSLFRSTNKCRLSSLQYLKIMDECDSNKDGQLDPREFSAFLARFALATGSKLDVLTYHLIECSPKEHAKQGRRMSMGMIWSWAESRMAEESLETVRQVEAARGCSNYDGDRKSQRRFSVR